MTLCWSCRNPADRAHHKQPRSPSHSRYSMNVDNLEEGKECLISCGHIWCRPMRCCAARRGPVGPKHPVHCNGHPPPSSNGCPLNSQVPHQQIHRHKDTQGQTENMTEYSLVSENLDQSNETDDATDIRHKADTYNTSSALKRHSSAEGLSFLGAEEEVHLDDESRVIV